MGDSAVLKSLAPPAASGLAEQVDFLRVRGFGISNTQRQAKLGQFPTPIAIAHQMAGMFTLGGRAIRLLDAGAGVGSLTAAFVENLFQRADGPSALDVTAFEIDADLSRHLETALAICGDHCQRRDVHFGSRIINDDFIAVGSSMLQGGLFDRQRFDCAILNPPYKKLKTDSEHRRFLRAAGIETSNLYTAFLALTILLLEPGGEMVAITPRSFCNGPYFRSFRELLLREMSIRAVHVFESRSEAFQDDEVLQENIIFHAVKSRARASVAITASTGPEEESSIQLVPFEQLVKPDDPERFIHIVTDDCGGHISELMNSLPASIADLGLEVSTGRVVEFRSVPFLRASPERTTVPLIYPTHFSQGWIAWPKLGSKKPNAIVLAEESRPWLVPAAVHVLVKRFSAKEEARRVVAAIFDPARIECEFVGFENHLNYFHAAGGGVPMPLAKGLAAFLNSTLVDAYFRQFNGHTQVNATDLRNLKFPTRDALEDLGACIDEAFPPQEELDWMVEKELLGMAKDSSAARALAAKRRIEEAVSALKALGLPREQQNERSGLTLLALLGLQAATPWRDAQAPLLGITPMMDYFAEHFAKKYAPNSRETVRRYTVHQFEQAGLIVQNPDMPRAVNSPDNVYQIDAGALKMLRTFGTPEWDKALATWLHSNKTLREKYAAERVMKQIPVVLPSGESVSLTQGGQNILIKHILEDFCPRYTPGAEILYVGDTGDKYAVFQEGRLGKLGVRVDRHGKMPDVVVYFGKKQWLVLIEAVTSHGPISAKRHQELKVLFSEATVGLVFVTAFLDRSAMKKYPHDIAWETEVWVAESPSHLIHFNGERFLGPY